ncbi:hypothetical protein WME88_27660 [Sorangium sp. So ce216]
MTRLDLIAQILLSAIKDSDQYSNEAAEDHERSQAACPTAPVPISYACPAPTTDESSEVSQ